MEHAALFNGIGGFQIAAELMGWNNRMSCEIDEWCNNLTKKRYPNCKQYGNIIETDFTIYRGKIDIITGGFPCQPFSVAGERKGTEDDRHLWPQMLRAITEISPRHVVAENVPGLLSQSRGLVFEQVCADLENAGYEVQPVIIPACAINAPHRRDRIWIVAFAGSQRRNDGRNHWQGRSVQADQGFAEKNKPQGKRRIGGIGETRTTIANACLERLQGIIRRKFESISSEDTKKKWSQYSGAFSENQQWEKNWIEAAAELCGMDDGLPHRVDRLKSLGNAVVWRIVYQIFQAIQRTENVMLNCK